MRFGVAAESTLESSARPTGGERPQPFARSRGALQGEQRPKTRERELEERCRRLEAEVAYLNFGRKGANCMNYECKITVLETKVFPELQEKYLADPKSGPCPCFKAGDTFLLKRTPEQDDFYHLMNGKFCGEAWDAISRYVYAALQGGSIMRKWTNDDRMMIACCNDGTRPVIFKIERIDIPENEEEKQWLEKQNFKNTADDAYTG